MVSEVLVQEMLDLHFRPEIEQVEGVAAAL